MTKKVLIVDDDPVIRILLQDCFSAANYNVTTLESGLQCLEHLGKEVPDILLLDNQMPVITGLEVLKKIRGDERLKHLQVVMMSANEATPALAREQGAEADLYLLKPFKIHAVLEALEEQLTAGNNATFTSGNSASR